MARSRQRLVRLGALTGAALTLAACQFIEIENDPMTALDPQGPFAQHEDDLFWPVFWIATAVFVLVQGAILVAVFLFRDKKGAKEAKQLHGSPKLEVLWTVIPALILAGIAVPTTAAVFELTECDPDAIQIDVIGHQWWFEYSYPDAEVKTANVMVIPAGPGSVCQPDLRRRHPQLLGPRPEREAVRHPRRSESVASRSQTTRASTGASVPSSAGSRTR